MDVNRYHRQALLPQVGPAGQATLAASRVLLVGCGALGSTIADQLVRAGVGFVRLVDRDVVELTNLQRQVLFDEDDARRGVPKAVAAAERLRRVNSTVAVEPLVADVHSGNVEALGGLVGDERPVDLMLDGTDNVETRYLLNDVAVKHGVPWVYGACVGTEGRVLAIEPGTTPCLRCVFPDPPGAGELPTCDTAGVLGPVASMVASFQAVEAMRLLLSSGSDKVRPPSPGVPGEVEGGFGRRPVRRATGTLVTIDAWASRFRTLDLSHDRRADCPCCAERRFEFLERRPAGGTTSLCGRDAVQVTPGKAVTLDLKAMASKLSGAAGEVEATPFLLRCRLAEPAGLYLTLFADGRLIVKGTTSGDIARSVYARYVGN